MIAGHWLLLAGALAVPNVVALVLMSLGLRERAIERLALLATRAKLCLVIVVVGIVAAAAGSAWQAFSAVRSDSAVDAGDKARLLAEGIAGAINCVAAGLVFTPLPLAASLTLSARRRRLAR